MQSKKKVFVLIKYVNTVTFAHSCLSIVIKEVENHLQNLNCEKNKKLTTGTGKTVRLNRLKGRRSFL